MSPYKIGFTNHTDTDSVHVRKRVQSPRFSPSSRAPHYNAEIVRPQGAREKWDSQSQLLYTEVRDACCSQLWPTQQLSGPDSCHYFSQCDQSRTAWINCACMICKHKLGSESSSKMYPFGLTTTVEWIHAKSKRSAGGHFSHSLLIINENPSENDHRV